MRVIDPVMDELAARMARRAGKASIRKNRVVAVHQETLARNLDNLFEDNLFPVVQKNIFGDGADILPVRDREHVCRGALPTFGWTQ